MMPSLGELLARCQRVVVAGVGCRNRGDDAFGPVLAARLRAAGAPAFDCGDRVEDWTGDIAAARPDAVLVADAIDLHARPGTVALVGADALPPGCGETHGAPLHALLRYLEDRTGATVRLLGVQPVSLAAGNVLSPEVAAAVDRLALLLGGAGSSPARQGREERS
jgi:hydrogenase 3 maturation protease